jgi:HSP20 family molecular chaperone IbpA
MALTPFAPLSALGTDTGRLFDDFFGGGLAPWTGGGLLATTGRGGLAGALRPLYTDVVERDNEYEMRVDVPGACCVLGCGGQTARNAARGRARTLRTRCAASGEAARRCVALQRNLNPSARCGMQLLGARLGLRWRLTRARGADVAKDNITLEAEGQVLRLSVRQESEKEDKSGDTWHRVERSSAFQTRALRFPDDADLSQVKADMESGVLRVCINKRLEAQQQQKRKQIKVA